MPPVRAVVFIDGNNWFHGLKRDRVAWGCQMPDWLKTDTEGFDHLLDVHEPLSTRETQN